MSTIKIFHAAALFAVLAAAACSGEGLSDRFAGFKFPSLVSGGEKEKAPQTTFNMSGRWMLSSPNRGQCGMNFSGGVQATEGAIAPEGGCPGNFFTSRKWTLEEGNVIIRDHNGEQLAKLSPVGSGRWLEGKAATGDPVMLAR